MKLLTDEFLSGYGDAPEHMNQMAQFTFYRTYSRWMPKLNRRETFKEAISRAVEYNVGISIKQYKENKFEVPYEQIRFEAEKLFDNIWNLRQFLSGRTHWVGGADTGVADKFPLANFNCAFQEINDWEDFTELFYLLLVGTGVGLACTKEMADALPPVRRDYTLIHSEYNPVTPDERLQETKLNIMENGYAKIYIGDNKESWTTALKLFLNIITKEEHSQIKNIKVSYNSIRPRGERLKTFGGTASGYEPMKEMFEGIDKVFKDEMDLSLEPMEEETILGCDGIEYPYNRFKVRPIHILDVANLIGNNVVAGGVRRTAEIFLCDDDDWEVILAKYGINGIWDMEAHKVLGEQMYALDVLPSWWDDKDLLTSRESLTHRYMSNNSISFKQQPEREMLHLIFSILKNVGEPGFVNMEAANKRRPNAKGLNPCAEILLDNKQVCNLTTINMMAFVKDGELDYSELMQSQTLSVRAGIRMTCIDLELEEWNMMHHRDRLIGASLTGWKDAMEALDYDSHQEEQLLGHLAKAATDASILYAHVLRIATPLLVTTVKPEGTLSQVANGVSSGLHVSHSPYFIRRIRINANDPLAKVAMELGWSVFPDDTDDISTARTLVVEFPIKSPAKKTRENQTLEEQFDTYFMFQNVYTDHNSSNTITVRDNEWDKAEQIVVDNWDNFVGVSFIPYDGGNYKLMPYEECTEEVYDEMIKAMKPFSLKLLHAVEKEETEKDVKNMESCETGFCPIF